MSASAAIFGRLRSATDAGERVYPLLLPEPPEYPAITYQEISSVRTHAMGQDGALIRERVQVNAWGKTYAEARSLADAVATQLSRFRGTVGTTTVLDTLLDNETTTYESETNTRRVIQDYTLFLSNA